MCFCGLYYMQSCSLKFNNGCENIEELLKLFDPHVIADGILQYDYVLVATAYCCIFETLKTNNGPKMAMLNNVMPSVEILCNT